MNRADIVADRLREIADATPPGNRLPTFRRLMSELNVSQATVASAFRRLEQEGRIVSRPGSGVYAVADGSVRPFLVICDPASMIEPSPFWGILLESILAPFREQPERIEVAFSASGFVNRPDIPVEKLLDESTWAKLRGRAFSGVIMICSDERLGWEIERLGVPVVAFGAPSHCMIRLGVLEACALGVSELVRVGCKRITLYNAPHISAKEVFIAALSAHGASEFVVPPTVAFRPFSAKLGLRAMLMDAGLRESTRLFGPESNPNERPDGVLSVDDMFTQGLLMGMERYGIGPGRGIEIATYVNRGSPVLTAWHERIISLEFVPSEMAMALVAAVEDLANHEIPSRHGWEQSVIMQQPEGPLRTLTIRPKVNRPAGLTLRNA